MTIQTKKEQLLGSAEDAAINVLVYNRKNDEDLSVEDVEWLFKSKQVTIDELVVAFRKGLEDNVS